MYRPNATAFAAAGDRRLLLHLGRHQDADAERGDHDGDGAEQHPPQISPCDVHCRLPVQWLPASAGVRGSSGSLTVCAVTASRREIT
ncbi:MAG TPA: hypothetical protein VI011_15690 [Asanoa sp.]